VVWRISLAFALLAFGTLAVSQDLGEAAAKEKERRKKLPASGKSYTGEDLEQGRPAPSPTPKAAPPSSALAPTAASRGRVRRTPATASAPREERSETETEQSEPTSATNVGGETQWRDRADRLRKEISDAEKRIADLDARIKQLALDRDPSPPDLLDPNRLQKREAERMKSVTEVEALRARIETARKALDDLREEARKKNVRIE
jgi:hypothetical protein